MKKIFKSSKAKGKSSAPEPVSNAAFDPPGYSLKEKDLPKLHKSAWGGELVKVQQLSKKGDVNQLDKGNRTALHLACSQGHKEIAAFLVSNKAKLNLCDNDQRSPLMKAAQGNHVACVETLLRSSADPNLVDKDGNTALHVGAHGGFVDVVLLLLKGGAMVNAPNKRGSTPLHLCTEAKQDVMAEVLLDNDADVNATDNDNRTALMLACQSDQIGLVKLLLERKADTEIKDSKGWTANDQAIMAGFHGCSHLIDEANSSRRPRSAVGRPGSSMFGSTGGSEGVGLGFSLGGGSARDEYDDDEDEISAGKDSFEEDSWGASASEVDEPVKPKPKVSKAVKLSKFIVESDDESIRSGDTSQRSTASKSRIPRAVSKDSLASNRSALRGANQDVSSSKIPRLAGTKAPNPTAATDSPSKAKAVNAGKGRSMSDPDPWDDTPTPTPRDDAPPADSFAATPRGVPLLTPRSSGLSFGESGSEWDDDDVLGVLEGTSPKKMTNVTKEEQPISAKPNDQVEKRPLSSQDKQQRKDVLNKLGMSDVEDDEDDDSSLNFTDEEPKKPSLVKQSLQSNPIIKAEDSPIVLKTAKAVADDEENEESDWDSDNDLLPSNASNDKDPPVIKPGDSGIQTNSDSLASKSKPASSPRVERKLPPIPSKEAPGKGGDSKEAGEGGAREDASRQEEHEGDEVIEDDDDDWDSDEDDEEEESEWEKARKSNRRASAHEELKQAQKTEISRQQQWEQEEAEREKKRKVEAEEELRKEQEEIERERQQREEEEKEEREREEEERQERERREAEKRKEEEKARQEAEKREREEAEQRRRDEERRAAKEKKQQEEQLKKLEQEKREKQLEAERQLEERQKKEDEDRKAEEGKRQKIEEERLKKMEQEMQEKQKEEERLREEKRKQEEAERKHREEELRQEMEKMKTVEERNEAERLHLEKERKRVEQERQQEELRREEDKKRLEMETKMELERIEAERAKLDAERRMMKKKQEEERKRNEDGQRLEKQIQEETRKKQDEERRRNEEERRRLEEEKEELKTLRLQQDEAKQRLADDRKREEDRRKFEEDRIKREEERLEMERKRIEEEAKKRQRELLQGMSSKSEGEKKQLEKELQRMQEEQQHEIQRRVEEFEEEKRRQAAEKSALERELELQSQRFKEERQKSETRQKEAEQQRQLMESQKEEELRKLTEERTIEMEQMKTEKLHLQKENQDIERKWQEIKKLKQEAENKESERYLQRYQKSIERRLQDEESNDAVTADGDHDHSSDIDADLHEMEAAVLQKQQQDVQGTSPVLSGSRRRNNNMSNGLDSQGNTAEFNQGLIGHNLQNPLHSTAASRSLRLTHNTLTNGNPHGLYSKQPAWLAILNEPDGLDSSSTDEDDDDVDGRGPATAEELQASFLSPYLTSTPQGLNTNQNAGGTSSADGPTDPAAFLRLQGQLREQKRIADREKGLRANADNHCKALEGDIDEMHRRVDEANHSKVALDQQLLDLEARVRTLEHELSQELEKRHNAEVILDKTKEQLQRKEEQYALEIEAKQKAELGSRNVSLELRTAQNLARQFEEERDELRSQLLHEKHARALQEELVQDQLHAQGVLHQETSRFFAEKAEAVSRLEAADESRKNVLNQSDRLKTELNALRVELERQRMRHRDDQGMLTSENEELTNKIEELKNEIRVSEEALAHATMAFNSQLMAVKTENAMLHGAVEKEMNKADKLQTKLESVDRRLQSTSQELESSQQARSELERSFQRDREEWSRGRDKLEAEVIALREAALVANKKITSTESKLRNLEKELQVTGTSLMERSNQLTSLQRELDSRNTHQSSHDTLLQKEKEDNYKISARMESLMERLNDSQSEISKLRRSLETAQQEKTQRDKDMMEAQEKFSNTLKTLQAENDRTRSLWDERVSTSSDNIGRLKEELQRSEHNRSLRDQEIRQIQQELTDALRKLSIAEANLDLARKTQNELDKEKQQQAHHMKQLQDQVRSTERDRRSLEARIEDLQSDLMQTQRNNLNTSQQLMVTQTSLQKKSELEERLRDLEGENARLEAAIRQEKDKSNSLEREVQDSNKMRVSLEDLVSNLQTTSMRMEGKLQEETANRSLFAKEAEDHRGLWELEVKSRSRLGLRIAQLERAKTEVQAQVDEEKKKVRKMAEMKRSYEERWQSEVQRTQLQEQEINTLKAKLRTAKKRLKDLDAPELRLNTLQTGYERERLNMEAAVATQRRQIDDLNQQLEREASLRVDVEKQNRQFQQELSSAKTHEKGKDKLEKTRRKLEEELTQMKLLVQHNFIEKGELEKYKQQLDAKARMELNEKLDQVNTYLEEQSQAREKLETLRNSNENELKKEQENTINDLKNEIGRLRSSYHDMLAQKETMEVEVARFKELYQDAVKKQDKLAAQLEKSQDRLVDTQAKFSLQKQRNRQMLDGSLDLSPSHLPKKQAPSPHVDSITEKVWSELDKSITRHLQAAPTDLGSSLAELRASALSRSYDGYNSPLRHENNQYLATLRKNYFV